MTAPSPTSVKQCLYRDSVCVHREEVKLIACNRTACLMFSAVAVPKSAVSCRSPVTESPTICTNVVTESPERCLQPLYRGPCDGSLPRWYFYLAARECRPYAY